MGKENKDAEKLCHVVTLSEHVDGAKQVDFHTPSPERPLVAGKPHWANYVKGVVAGYGG